MTEPTLDEVNQKIDEILDDKFQEYLDLIKSEIDKFSMNTPEHQILKRAKEFWK